MLTIQQEFIQYNFEEGNFPKKYIGIHETDNTDATATALAHYRFWNNTPHAGGSAHFVVDDSNIIQLVRIKDCSYGTGVKYGPTNIQDGTLDNVINIEICVNAGGDYMKARQNAIDLVKYLLATETYLTPDSVVRHYDLCRKYCPRKMMDNPSLWEDFKARIVGKSVPVQITTGGDAVEEGRKFVADRCRELQQKLNAAIDAGLSEDGIFGIKTYTALTKFQGQYGLVVDGLAGIQTFSKLNSVIAEKSATPTPQPTPAPAPAPQPSGDSEVVSLQHSLNRLHIKGANGNALVEDGITGANTTFATKRFQEICGLEVDGVVGSNTNGALNAIFAKPTISIHSDNKVVVRYLQWAVGAGIDGDFGNQTLQCVKEYQGHNGLSSDGVVGPNTWGKLIG